MPGTASPVPFPLKLAASALFSQHTMPGVKPFFSESQTRMRNQRLSKHVSYAVISLACPIVALLVTLACQSIANASFWRSIITEESAAGTIEGFSEVIQLIVFLMVGCLTGLLFAAISLRLQRRVLGIGLAALVFNGLPPVRTAGTNCRMAHVF
jgi:uncharacterized membrane protein YbjE (DUF340 family)